MGSLEETIVCLAQMLAKAEKDRDAWRANAEYWISQYNQLKGPGKDAES